MKHKFNCVGLDVAASKKCHDDQLSKSHSNGGVSLCADKSHLAWDDPSKFVPEEDSRHIGSIVEMAHRRNMLEGLI